MTASSSNLSTQRSRPAAYAWSTPAPPVRSKTQAAQRTPPAPSATLSFKAEVEDLLEEADARKRMGRVRDALDGESPAELREAIAELGAQGGQSSRRVVTTHDLPAGA